MSDIQFDADSLVGDATPASGNGVQFTIGSTGVTGVSLVFGSKTIALKIPANETFSVDSTAGTVKATFTGTSATESILFTQDPSTSLYHVSSVTTTVTSPTTTTHFGTAGINFTTTGSAITGMQEVVTYNSAGTGSTSNTSTTKTHTLAVSPDATFSGTVGGPVTETTVQGNTVTAVTFVQPAAGGLYVEQSETTTFIPAGSATTLLDVDPYDHLNLTISNNSVTQVQALSPNGTATTLTLHTGVAFQEVTAGNASFVEETITHGTHTSYVLFMQSSANGSYTEIAHGSGTTVDLVGINAQLSQIPAANLTLI
ncbi:MAG TPA: hypothetical protein VMH83_10580 [Candidatus Acidoferrum sp.]|nr:hypothetical protein [Candidatus Acidoferrum sp.]